MSRDRLQLENMTVERASDIVSHVVVERDRWGKNYRADDIRIDTLLDALIMIARSESETEAGLRKELTLVKRQLTASSAREAKLKKQIAKLKGEEVDQDDDEKEALDF